MTTDRTTPLPDIDALSRNATLLIEEFTRTAGAYMKPISQADPLDPELAKPPEEVNDVVKTLGTVAERWMVDPQKSLEAQKKAQRRVHHPVGLDLASPPGRGSPARGFARGEGQPLQTCRMVHQPDLRLHQAELPHHLPLGRGARRRGRWDRRAYAPQGPVLPPADRRRALAVQFRDDQSRTDSAYAAGERRQSRARHEDARGGYRSWQRSAARPPDRSVRVRGRRQRRRVPRRGGVPQRPDGTDPVFADHRDGAEAPVPDRAAPGSTSSTSSISIRRKASSAGWCRRASRSSASRG